MARPIVLSNGELHVGLNNYGLVHDFYFPYVGLENHSAGQNLRHKIGVWVDGQLSWLDDDSWQLDFKSADEALVGHVKAKHERLQVAVEFDDFISAGDNIFLRNIHIINMSSEERDIRLFMHQAFVIGDARSNTDTAQYLSSSDALLHYRGRRAFVIGGRDQDGQPFDQHAIGLFGIEDHEGTWRDAEDGELSGSNVEHGRVDSTIRFQFNIAGHNSKRLHYWITAGTSAREALILNKIVQEKGLDNLLESTVEWWHEWLGPALKVAEKVPSEHREGLIKSAMIIKSHIDKRGALIASTDTAMLNYSRDAYGYCWPRDGAYSLWPLIRMGYRDEPKRFFEFCAGVLHPRGYLMHKFQADGALGSSWHPYVHNYDGEEISAPPIQEDETAVTLFVFSQFYHAQNDKMLLEEFYEPFIKKMANFMAANVQESTGLPRASYDLWEEVFLTTTYTTSVTYAALLAAADLAEVMNDKNSAVRWRSVAEDIRMAAVKHLYNKDRGHFRKGLLSIKGKITYDDTLDSSSFFGAFMYGLFDAGSEEITSTLESMKRILGDASQPGFPRYENDEYRRQPGGPSNWWFICSLWVAQYYLETGDKQSAETILDWVHSKRSSTGMLSEQISPVTGEMLSVSPLTWSEAEYLATLLDLVSETDS